MTIKYKIIALSNGQYELRYIVETGFRKPAVNFICRGTYEYCANVKQQIEWG